MIAWTPPGSQFGLGSILTPQVKVLEPDQYRSRLADRINRLVGRETKERAATLLRQAGEHEPISPENDLPRAGEILANHSQWLRERAAMPSQPVKGPLKDNPEIKGHLEDETLEEFLGALYHDR